MIKDVLLARRRGRMQPGKADDGLGSNSDIGARLRALYGAVQEETIPGHLLDLLEKLDSAEAAQATGTAAEAAGAQARRGGSTAEAE